MKEPEGFIVKLDDSDDYLIYRHAGSGAVEITDIAVYTERCKGRGRALVEKMMQELPDDTSCIYALARANNIMAHRFYRALGFVQETCIRSFYNDGCRDAAMFAKKL